MSMSASRDASRDWSTALLSTQTSVCCSPPSVSDMEAEGANAGSVQVSIHGTSGMKSASSGPSGCDWSMTTPRNESLKHESKSEGAKGATSVSEGAVIVGDNEEAAGDAAAIQ